MVLHRTFRPFPLSVRFHAGIRYLTCPFGRILDAVDLGGARVLEIGAGHGIYSRLAVDRGASGVVAVDPDLRKVLPSFRHPAIRFVAGFDDAISGRFDRIVMIDVLYKIPIPQWDALLSRVTDRLGPEGVFVLKEHDPTRRLKQAWNHFQESLNTRLLGITMGDAFAYEPPAAMVQRLNRAGFARVEVIPIDRWRAHPHILYVARKGANRLEQQLSS